MMTHAWGEAFHQLWTQAVQHRGVTVEALPEQLPDHVTEGWPRTRGSDVLAIAAVVDPVVRTLAVESGGFGIERRWRHIARHLATFALDRPTAEYAENRAFWSTLAATLAHLASVDAPVPRDLWRALLAEITNPIEESGATGGDHVHLTADSYEALWRIQHATLSQLRGVELHASSADARMRVPRTTNADVLQLATFWTLALIKVEPEHRGLDPDATARLGLDGVQRRWRAVLADIDAHAKTGHPRDAYAKNHEFWRTTAAVSVAISALDDLPLSLDFAVNGGPIDRRNARTFEFQETTFDRMWTAQHEPLLKARGYDEREPSAPSIGGPLKVPRTTNADILQLATYWQNAWAKLEDAAKRGHVLDHGANPAALADERTRWQAAIADVDRLARPGKPDDVYLRNHEFWRASLSLATTLGRFDQRPTPSQLTLDVPEEDFSGRIWDFVTTLTDPIGQAVNAVARAVGNVAHKAAHEAGAGFFDSFGVPILIGAGGLVVLWLLLRRNDDAEAA